MHAPIPPAILEALTRGAILLTPAQRPARALRQAFDAHQRAAGLTLWRSPEIFALETWLASLHQNLVVSGQRTALVLNRTQQHFVWRNIIAADGKPGRSTAALATLALDAYATLCMHNGRHRLDEAVAGPDSRAFRNWARDFERHCTRYDYSTPAQLPAALEAALAEGHRTIPPRRPPPRRLRHLPPRP